MTVFTYIEMQNQNQLNIVLIRLIISCTRMKNVAKAYSNMYMYIEKEKKMEKDNIWNRK